MNSTSSVQHHSHSSIHRSPLAIRFRMLLACLALLCHSAVAQDKRPTAREVIASIQQHVGVPWQNEAVDTFKAGNPDTPVTGVAVTMMATLDVLQRASAQGLNLVITHEPTFYNHLDTPAMDQSDPVWAEKRAFIEKHGLVIWRFHDHWHMRKPDGIEAGMIHALKHRKPVSFHSAGNHVAKARRRRREAAGFARSARRRESAD